jgi:hypothetical protein
MLKYVDNLNFDILSFDMLEFDKKRSTKHSRIWTYLSMDIPHKKWYAESMAVQKLMIPMYVCMYVHRGLATTYLLAEKLSKNIRCLILGKYIPWKPMSGWPKFSMYRYI